MDLAGPGIFSQIVIALLITAAIFLLYMVLYQLYKIYNGYSNLRIAIVPNTASTCSSCSAGLSTCSNPCNPKCLTLPISENQLTGIEFSYTGFIYINPSTDDDNGGWKTIFYKGYEKSIYPLMAPGVFISGANYNNGTPTLRVVMNTYDNWFNAIDVNQVPFNKWIHLAIVLRNNAMEIYINGNLANKQSFKGTLPYQNYEGVQVAPPTKTEPEFDNSQKTTAYKGIPPGENMNVTGKFDGYISRLYYFPYAITYSEIMSMMNVGPSQTMEICNNLDKPPYLIDSWWTQTKN